VAKLENELSITKCRQE